MRAANVCSRPCAHLRGRLRDRDALKQHLDAGFACVDAWIALSEQVATAAERRNCLAHASALAPGNEALRCDVLTAELEVDPANVAAARELRARLQGHAPLATRANEPRRIGEIALSLGLVDTHELAQALAEQVKASLKTHRRIGETLMAQRCLAPKTLVQALMIQHNERTRSGVSPRALGEFLVAQELIDVVDLEAALLEQARAAKQGETPRFGDVLIQQRRIKPLQLETALAHYEQDYWQRFQ